MIQAKELRIGNWVMSPLMGKPVSLGSGDIYQFDIGNMKLDAIILTPEILKQAGFEKVKHVDDYVFYTGNRRSSLRIISIYEERTTVYGYSVPHCKYLHQLQNLVLTNLGTELNITL